MSERRSEHRPAETRAKVKAGTYEEAYFYRVDALRTRSNSTEGSVHSSKFTEFVDGVKKAFRGCEIVQGYAVGTETFRAFVYMPEDTFCMGVITVHDPAKYRWGEDTVTINPELIYSVWSHTVDNNKYGRGKRERYSTASKDINKAIKNAKKYLRRVTHKELTMITREEYVTAARQGLDKLRRNADLLTDEIGVKSYNVKNTQAMPLYKELVHLLDMGTGFLNKEFETHLRQLRDEMAAYESANAQRAAATDYCVRVYESRGRQVFSMAMMDGRDANPNYSMTHSGKQIGDTIEYTEDTLPEWVAGKLSLLSMCDEQEYIEGVGYHYDRTIFYVTD
tara:strand:+ start:2594 stop:3601 length:1008 start_codon:yes stop_codon:yes gene_type:complete